MAAYGIEISAHGLRAIRKLTPDARSRVIEAIQALAIEPRPHRCLKLKARVNEWRIHVGRDYRVRYRIDDTAKCIEILDAGPRAGFYDE